MYFNLENFIGQKEVYSFAHEMETVEKLQKLNQNILFFDKNKCYLYPDGVSFDVTDEEQNILNTLWEEDVLQFNGNKAYLYYSAESDDNVIMVTGKCNSNCIMCPASANMRKKGETARIDELMEVSHHIPNRASHLTITGGEPFLLGKDIFKVLEYLKNNKSKMRYLILTNGRIFSNNTYCDLLVRSIPKNTTLGIPIHGYNSQTHDFVTQANGSFEQTLIGLKKLLSNGIAIELRYVVSKLTAGYIKQMSELVVKELPTVGCVKIMGLEMLGNAAINRDQVWIDYKEAFEAAKQGIDILVENGINVELYNFPLCMVDEKYWGLYKRSISGYKVRYLEECNTCKEKNSCGGIFAGTVRLVDKVYPI